LTRLGIEEFFRPDLARLPRRLPRPDIERAGFFLLTQGGNANCENHSNADDGSFHRSSPQIRNLQFAI